MKARLALAALSLVLIGSLVWVAWPRSHESSDLERTDTLAPANTELASPGSELAASSQTNESRTPAVPPPAVVAPIESTSTEEDSALLRGLVLDQGTRQPVSDARVMFLGVPTVTDRNGEFRIERLPVGGRDSIIVQSTGHADFSRALEALKPGDTSVQIDLVRGGHILHVSVIDAESGANVPDAVVTAEEGGFVGAREADGSFPVEVADGNKLSLQAAAQDYCEFEWSWQVKWRTQESRTSIPLLRAACIEGSVVDDEGKPVEGASLYTSNPAIPFGYLALSDEERATRNLPGYAVHARRDTSLATDATGRFRTSVLPSEHATSLHVSAKPFISHRSEVLAAIPGRTSVVRIVMERGATIRGSISKNAAPWSGTVRCESPPGSFVSWAFVKNGTYEVTGIPLGNVLVRLMTPGAQVSEREATVVISDQGVHDLDFAWQEELTTIAGRVVNAAGQPVSDAPVRASTEVDDEKQLHFRASTGSDGTFSIQVAPGLLYTISTAHHGVRLINARLEQIAAGTSGVELVLPDFGRLRLRLVDAETGSPVRLPGPSVDTLRWRKSGDPHYLADFDPRRTGSEVVLDLPTGNIDLLVNLQSAGFLPWSTSGHRVTNGSTEKLEVRLTRAVEARIELIAQSGESLSLFKNHILFFIEESQLDFVRGPFPGGDSRSNAKINGIAMWLQDPTLHNQMLSIDETGIALLRGLAPGRYSLRAFPADFDIEPAFVTIAAGARAELQFRWRSRE